MIKKKHFYHGAALAQIAEHSNFTAINADASVSGCAYIVNQGIGIYVKYAVEPKGKSREYSFTFLQDYLAQIKTLHDKYEGRVFVVMVCVSDGICALKAEVILDLIGKHNKVYGRDKNQYQIFVSAPSRKQFRLYVNDPQKKGHKLYEVKVPRDAFPSVLFN